MIPIICTIDIGPDVGYMNVFSDSSLMITQLINEFLVKTYAGEPDAPEDLCVITTQDWSQYCDEARLSPKEARKQGQVAIPRGGGPMKSPSRPPWTTSFETPFRNQDPESIAQFLQNAGDMPSDMEKRYCIILDERTFQDKSVLLVKTSRGPESNLPENNQSPIVQYRSSFEDANAILQTVCVGQGSLEAELWNNSSN